MAFEEGALEAQIRFRLTLVLLCSALVSVGIALRAGYLQIPKNSRLETLARKQFRGDEGLVKPSRGGILDRFGEVLAINIETYSLAIHPLKLKQEIQDYRFFSKRISKLFSSRLKIPQSIIMNKLNSNKEFVWIKRHLSKREVTEVQKMNFFPFVKKPFQIKPKIGVTDLNGLWFMKEMDRLYPQGQLAAHLLGDVNVDLEGLEGIELWMNHRLRGSRFDFKKKTPAQDGESVTLSIDATLQFKVEQLLAQTIQKTHAKSGTVIVMEATQGEVLAMANEPTFDPSDVMISIDKRRNRAVTDGYEPGSTMKPLLLAAALSHGFRLSDTVWAEEGQFVVQNHRISEAEAHEKFGWLSLKKMVQVSSNIAAAKVGLKLGADAYWDFLNRLGFGEKTGIEFPGEISGRLPAKKSWQPLTLATLSFGHGILVTPIQMVRAYAVLANGGMWVQPQLFLDGEQAKPQRILSEAVVRDVTEALCSVTQEGGTGTRAQVAGYRIAGKTGTSQLVDPHQKKYSAGKYIASFIGFPVEVDPKVVIFVSIVEPQGVYYGAQIAAPLFREVFQVVAHRLSLPHHLVSPLRVASSAYLQSVEFQEPVPQEVQEARLVPQLKGLTQREVFRLLPQNVFSIEFQGVGVVVSQSPEAGQLLKVGQKVKLILKEPE